MNITDELPPKQELLKLVKNLRDADLCACELHDYGNSTRDFYQCITCKAASAIELLVGESK